MGSLGPQSGGGVWGGVGGLANEAVRVELTHKPLREIAVKPSLQCVSFLSSSSSEWAIVEDSISLVVSDKNI